MIKSIKVGYKTYKVQDLEKRLVGDRYGDTDIDGKVIRLRKGLETDVEMETLIHEIFHAIFDSQSLPSKNEEEVVTGLAKGLMGVFKDNPRLLGEIDRSLQ